MDHEPLFCLLLDHLPPPPSMPRPPPSVIHPLISVFFTQPWLSVEFEEAKIFILCLLCLTPVSPQVPKYLSISVHLDNATSVHLSHLSRGTRPIPRAPSWPLLCLFFFLQNTARIHTNTRTDCLSDVQIKEDSQGTSGPLSSRRVRKIQNKPICLNTSI